MLDTPCETWLGHIGLHGYGTIYDPSIKKKVRAHRKVWATKHGPIPDGMVIMHKCDNRSCVNEEHLKLGTQGQNLEDMWAKGRQGTRNLPVGEKHHATTLTIEQVKEIRGSWAASTGQLARTYGVSTVTIRNIKARRTWCHV